MDRRQRRLFKRKTRRIGVVAASVAMLAATAGLGGAAFAVRVPGGATGGGGGQGGGAVNKTVFATDESGVFRFHASGSEGGAQYNTTWVGYGAYAEHYNAPNDWCFSTATGEGRIEYCKAP